MIVSKTFSSTRSATRGATVLVPTMGYLHEGHLSLMDLAKDHGDSVIVSLFVNPLQFNDPSDLVRYPRDFDRDAGLCEERGVDVLFAPELDEMYPTLPLTEVTVTKVADSMEGSRRSGHFRGVATVVTKLLAGLRPEAAVFGRKDAQQLAVIKTLVADLSFPLEIIEGSTVREPDGLALSSRNVFLDPAARSRATSLSRGLMMAADLAEAGEREAPVLAAAVRAIVEGVELEYVELASADRASILDRLDRAAFLAVAGVVGGVRLIDNVVFDSQGQADRGTVLTNPSIIGVSP